MSNHLLQIAEKNCHPHNPHWGCVGFGRREAILDIIFHYAAGTEGGMFHPRSGYITPEGYVQRWIKALREAIVVEPQVLEVDRSMHPMRWEARRCVRHAR